MKTKADICSDLCYVFSQIPVENIDAKTRGIMDSVLKDINDLHEETQDAVYHCCVRLLAYQLQLEKRHDNYSHEYLINIGVSVKSLRERMIRDAKTRNKLIV